MTDSGLDADAIERYARQLVLPAVGAGGQAALREADVLVVGCGGLGSPVVQYLAAAGVGTLAVADDDDVETSNLHRQVLHGESDVGTPKVHSAAEFVSARNPDVTVETHETAVGPENAADLVAGRDAVVDASDNFPTRFLLNDACRLAGVPLVYGAVHAFEGQAATFRPGGPCYRCLFPEAPPPGAVPDCAEAGVLGSVTGVVGAVQATEALKLLIGAGETLDDALFTVDALSMTTDRVALARRPDCPLCGDDPAVTSLDDVTYDGRCAVR